MNNVYMDRTELYTEEELEQMLYESDVENGWPTPPPERKKPEFNLEYFISRKRAEEAEGKPIIKTDRPSKPTHGTLSRAPTFDDVLRIGCEIMNVDKRKVLSKSRVRAVTTTRDIIICAARDLLRFSYPELTKLLNRSNHSTIITSHHRTLKKIEAGKTYEGTLIGDIVDAIKSQVTILVQEEAPQED